MTPEFSESWLQWRANTDLDEYETRWDRRAAEGGDVHGEADFVMHHAPTSVLDAGCGMGRVGIELHRRGVDVVGADLDPDLLERARRRAPHLDWHEIDLADLELGRTFDIVVMAGNVLPFARPERRPMMIAALARHVAPAGLLIAGASLRPDWPGVDDQDDWARTAGLVRVDRFAGWGREPWAAHADYAVSVYRRD
jgi:SAM-dependent methyltransferase